MGTTGKAEALARWRATKTPEQTAAWRRKISEAVKRSRAVERGRVAASSNGAPANRVLGIAVQERVGGKYVPHSSRTIMLANSPWDSEEMLRLLEKFAGKLKAKFQADGAPKVRVASTTVVDFAK